MNSKKKFKLGLKGWVGLWQTEEEGTVDKGESMNKGNEMEMSKNFLYIHAS